jgi:DNA-binding CsgD family transcriptional regulator
MDEYDSATYYYDLTLNHIPDRNTLLYRDWVALTALNNYYTHHDTLATLDSLKSLIAQSASESERLTRFLAIGSIYSDLGRDDSAKYYFEPVFEFEEKSINKRVVSNFLRLIALKEGDTLKANQYAQVMAENTTSPGESQTRVSKLNEMFQSYLQEKQEAVSVRERKKAVRTTLLVLLALAVVLGVVTLVIRNRRRKHITTQEEAAQKRFNETAQELKNQVDEAVHQAQTMLPQRVNDIYRSKISNRMERIMEEFEAAYPQVLEHLTTAYPDLNPVEQQIAVLNFLRFRSKEEADLLGLTESTVFKYRSNLKKKAGSDPISALVADRKN